MPDFTDVSGRAKPAIRAELLAVRRAMPPAARAEADAALRAALVGLVAARRPRVVAGYAPMPGEPGGPALPDALPRVLLPVVRPDGELDWAVHTGELRPGPYRLREPAGLRLGPEALATAALIVVPAVAVDRRGIRLGRGGGFYDRALTRAAPDALIVALVYDGELVDALPAQPHDRPVHGVVTPSRGVLLLTGTRPALDETTSDDAPLALED